jgi:class 3 adenylate cyclase/pimeloyl-ACP methyl ester carboxylesterase
VLAADIVGYSRLMERDEPGTHERVQVLRKQLIEPLIAEHRGHIVKLTGDGALCEFQSVVDAVACAMKIQQGMSERERDLPEEERIRFRIGVNVGDIIVDPDGDIYGDGVNIAARLEAIAESGGICISRQTYDQVDGKVTLAFRPLGLKKLKNIAKPVEVFAVDVASASPGAGKMSQEIYYCRAPDGVRIAWSKVGSGPPLAKTANWMSHLEFDWESPIWRHLLRKLARDHTVIRYDHRGMGLSDWDVSDVSFEARVSDLETVVNAAGIQRFPLLGISGGCAISIAYAVRHPKRVSHLILYGGFAVGRLRRARHDAERENFFAMKTLMRSGWGQENPAFRQIFTSEFIPGGSKEQIDWLNELQRRTTSPDSAARLFQSNGEVDLTELMPQVTAPTLVMHAREDAAVPFQLGQQMAAGIPGAQFVVLPGQNHLFLEGEPATDRFFEELKIFLSK